MRLLPIWVFVLQSRKVCPNIWVLIPHHPGQLSTSLPLGHWYIGPTLTTCAISVQKIKRSVGTQSIPECPHISTHTMFARFPYQFAIKHLKLTPRQVWKTWRGLLLFLCFMLAAGEMSPVPQRSHYWHWRTLQSGSTHFFYFLVRVHDGICKTHGSHLHRR